MLTSFYSIFFGKPIIFIAMDTFIVLFLTHSNIFLFRFSQRETYPTLEGASVSLRSVRGASLKFSIPHLDSFPCIIGLPGIRKREGEEISMWGGAGTTTVHLTWNIYSGSIIGIVLGKPVLLVRRLLLPGDTCAAWLSSLCPSLPFPSKGIEGGRGEKKF